MYEEDLNRTLLSSVSSTGSHLDTSIVGKDPLSLGLSAQRWRHVVLYVLAGVANSIILLTWAPISDLAASYFDVPLTLINFLSILTAGMYIPGTLLMVYVQRQWLLDFRGQMLTAATLNGLGVLIRFCAALVHESSTVGSFTIMTIGTAIAALSQPFFLNLPAALASRWFDLSERDIATTCCSLASPLGSAIGSIIPAMLVTRKGGDDDGDVEGVTVLIGVQLAIASASVAALYMFFSAYPDTPPTTSALKEREAYEKSVADAGRADKDVGERGANALSPPPSLQQQSELWQLFTNRNFRLLFIGFTLALAHLNSLAVLLNQLPGGYDNATVGLLGAVLILSGFCGAFVTGFVLEYTKAYESVLKGAYMLALVAVVTFMSNCGSGNTLGLILSGAFVGFAILPVVPASIVNCVETVYPLSGDLAVGVLYSTANILAVPFTFIGQVTLHGDDGSDAPGFPYGIWIMTTMAAGLAAVLLFQGSYARLNQDKHASNKEAQEVVNALMTGTIDSKEAI